MSNPIPDTEETESMTRLDGQELLELCEEDPQVACRDETRESCAYKREYDHRLSKFNIESLLQHPNCEACECPLVVIHGV